MEHTQQSKLDNLFFDVRKDVENTSFFVYFFISMRGLGKTYSALRMCIESKKKFLYLRRTEKELKNCVTPLNNPFKSLNKDFGYDIKLTRHEDICSIDDGETNYGLAGALSTFGKFRGSDLKEIEYIIFDEFINTQKNNYLKPHEEIDYFANMIETILRNDEIIKGKKMKIIMLSNANNLRSGILSYLNLAEIIREMKVKDREIYTNKDRGIYIRLPKGEALQKIKKKTSLYKLMQGTDYYEMALNNEFVTEDFSIVKKIASSKLVPLCSYESMFFYMLKDSDKMYVTKRKSNCIHFSKNTFEKFRKSYLYTIQFYSDNNSIIYSDYNLKVQLDNLCK